MHFV
jgi:hypothetical protein